MCFPIPGPKEKEWKYKGIDCVVTRADMHGHPSTAHRCGYIRVPPDHPWYGKEYEDVPASCHGGLTFAEQEPCTHDDGQGWWFGFDFHHGGDAAFPDNYEPPTEDAKLAYEYFESFYRKLKFVGLEEHYWTLEEVIAETEQLAQQAIDAIPV